MATVDFANLDDTNLKNIDDANITDATASAYTFTGAIGTTFAIEAQDAVVAISNGECSVVDGGGSPTYVAIKGTSGALGLYEIPQIAP